MAEQQTFRMRITFAKQGRLALLSHLEVARAIERAVRRAQGVGIRHGNEVPEAGIYGIERLGRRIERQNAIFVIEPSRWERLYRRDVGARFFNGRIHGLRREFGFHFRPVGREFRRQKRVFHIRKLIGKTRGRASFFAEGKTICQKRCQTDCSLTFKARATLI